MKTRTKDRGSALILATIVIIVIVGVSGAYLAFTISSGKTQFALNQSDEAQMICDAAIEKLRRGLYLYKKNNSWPWDSILQYCQSAPPKSSRQMITDLAPLWNSTLFHTYLSSTNQPGQDTANDAPSFTSQTWSSGDPVFIAQYTPFAGGAFYALVTNNDDSATGGTPTHDTDNTVIVTVTATLRSGVQRKVEAVIQYINPFTTFPGLAAIISDGPDSFLGNITVDGRDYDINGTAVVGPGVYAAMSGGTVSWGGSSSAGGNGQAPSGKGPSPNSTFNNQTNWSPLNAPSAGGGPPATTFPSGPDGALKLPTGTLKASAQAAGTYFSDQGTYNSYIAAHGGQAPGGAIIYCEFTPSPPFELGSGLNPQPSILVVHNASGNADVKNIHGDFKGLIIADTVTHINAGTMILGCVFAWGQTGNVFGNGNANVDFSSAVLNDLPAPTPSVSAKLLSWRKLVP